MVQLGCTQIEAVPQACCCRFLLLGGALQRTEVQTGDVLGERYFSCLMFSSCRQSYSCLLCVDDAIIVFLWGLFAAAAAESDATGEKSLYCTSVKQTPITPLLNSCFLRFAESTVVSLSALLLLMWMPQCLKKDAQC